MFEDKSRLDYGAAEDSVFISNLLEYRPPCTPKVVDFRNVPDIFFHRDVTRKNFSVPVARNSKGRLMRRDRVKSRAKRFAKRIEKEELDILHRPVEEWDLEELARGRPRNSIGTFAGRPPAFVTRLVHEAAMSRFKEMIKADMNSNTITAIGVIETLLNSREVDARGKALVPPSTKLDASKFLIEHILGKPTQRVETDISVKLQGILGTVMINPGDTQTAGYHLAHLPGVTMPMAEAEDDIIDADI